MKIIGNITIFILFIVIGSIVNGYVLSVLWEWFIESYFDIGGLTISQAIGFSLFIGFLIAKPESFDDRSFLRVLGEGAVSIAVRSVLTLLTGFVVIQFI